MSKYNLLLFILFQILSCTSKEKHRNVPTEIKNSSQVSQQVENGFVSKEEAFLQLKKMKAEIDTLKSQKKLELEVLVKEPNKEKLILVRNEEWPEEVEKTFNIWKNSEGQVIVVGEFPYSESGDWDIEYIHYFDKNGKTFSFEKNTNFFNSICTDGVAFENTVEFYNSKFEKINQNYNFVNEAKEKLKKEDCVMNYDFPYSVSRNLKNYLEKINYRSQQQ